MVRYDIAALLSRFDKLTKAETALTGKLSSLLGESLLLSALVRYLAAVEGHEVRLLAGRPHRDDREFPAGAKGVPRDLDAWLLLGAGRLAAVECKHWTSSSPNYRSVPEVCDARAAYARDEMWDWLVREHFVPRKKWTDVNKVALPLKPPAGMPAADVSGARRILAVWTPISSDGRSLLSRVSTTTVRGGKPAGIEVEVFSASMFLRDQLAAGVTHLESEDEGVERLLAELGGLVRAGFSAAG